MPELVELGPKLEADNVRVIAVSIDLALPEQITTAEQLAAFAERRGIALPLLAFEGDFDALADAHGFPGGPPFNVLYGPAGELGRVEGPATPAEVEALAAKGRGPASPGPQR